MVMGLGAAMAQDSSRVNMHRSRPHHQEAYPGFSQLNLTDAQKQQLKTIREEQQAKMMAVLTPAQKEQWKKQQEIRRKHPAGKKGIAGKQLKEKLQLTDEQSAKMKGLNDSFRQQAGVIRANQALSDADRKSQLKKLSAEHRSEINAMLTPAQQETLRQLKEQNPKRTVR